MGLTKLAINRPVVIIMLFLALAVMGFQSRSKMPVELYPKIDIPYILIMTTYPGAGPEEIETLVSKPIEDSVGSVNGVKNITSTSLEGMSAVVLECVLGTDLDTALADARAKVDATQNKLPDDCKDPTLIKVDVGAMPVILMGMSSNRPAKELRDLADNVIKDRLSKVKGVASVTISGGDKRQIQVNVDRHRLEAYGISIGQVQQALAAGNLNMPSGSIKEANRDYSVRALGEFKNAEEIRALKINVFGRVLTIGDIANVSDTVAERTQATRVQRKDSIGISVQKQADANTVEVVDGVKKELESMKEVLPSDVAIAVAFDQSTHVKDALDDVNLSLWLGALLAVIIVYLFLHNIRGTFIVALAIPTSIISTYIPTHFLGFTQNMTVMLGLSLAVGILVDDSIVVLENIYRHLTRGEAPAEAALNGRSEIGLAAVTITMVDVVVFVPIAFMGGITGQFFKQFGITVACATLFSLLVSFTLTPMLASRWYKKHEDVEASSGFFKAFDDFYRRLDAGYRRMLAWTLHHRWQVIASGWGILLVMIFMVAPKLGFEFSPQSDRGQVDIAIEMPAETSLAATNMVTKEIEDAVANIPEIESMFTNVGSSGSMLGGGEGSNLAKITLSLKETKSGIQRLLGPLVQDKDLRVRKDTEIQAQIQKMIAKIPAGNVKVQAQSGMGPGGSPIDIELTGDNTEELDRTAQRIKQVISGVPGVINPDVSWKVGKPEVRAKIDRVKAADMGLTMQQIAAGLRTSIAGNTDIKFRTGGNEYDIDVRLREFDRYSLPDVGRTVVGATSSGAPIYLADVADLSFGIGPTKIERKNRQRKVSVTADVAHGYTLGRLKMALEKEIAAVPLGNTRLNWGGDAESMKESAGDMGGALILAILLVYMLMAALFESFFNPLVIMASLPMALIGALLALWMTGETLSIISMIGIIMLMGLVTKNAILLVDYTHTLRERGMSRNDAILEAGPTRLRPILMTTMAMIFGMLPTALKLGRGSEMRAPMAIAVIGGLIVSTLLTLLMIPVTYTLMDDFVNWCRKTWHKVRHGHHKHEGGNKLSGGNGDDPEKMLATLSAEEAALPEG
jgi:HAE1 family hydrophobic/amphiphilic exporter-1